MAANDNKNISRIESLIDEIEKLVEHSKPSGLSQTKVVINKGQLLELTSELRMKAPEEIKRYRKMIDNRDAIIADANARAKGMIEEAEKNISNLIQEHEIVQQALSEADEIIEDANRQANQIVYEAEREADMIRKSSFRYMADNLSKLQNLIDSTVSGVDSRYRSMMSAMEKYSALVKENREELYGAQKQEEPSPDQAMAAPVQEDMQDDALEASPSDFE